ncbi:CPBP family intramembrane metalloprotease [Microbacterium sp. zg-Y818]|uniref:CPBP family intramembrane glutamic endopeptidase n=1 Tax=unclassified Microbacterium TaxID=2609290 RepID=UPI00214A8CC0|nr:MULTISPECIES: CPBP family intramembrane glutamic endopeptidase [unclassified Microbacterium]MCR2799476.1 CPBP family intramembrane metalloprotease [Microbacterium sp. zg.Y818]WIM21473.1 CPBP family intramembrane metalloprotease [Microbacterium sp. zg-Y818]
MTDLIQRRPLTAFFILAFLGSWVAWSPWWLSQSGIGLLPFQLPFAAIAGINQVGLFAGPFAAAFLVTRVCEGRQGARRLQLSMVKWRARPAWYLLALLVIPLATALGYFLLPGTSFALEGGFIAVLGLLAITYVTYLLGGPIQEEPGWRGFALPRLQQRLHPMTAALALGVIHCLWHAPLFLTAEWDTARQEPSQFLAYLVLVVSMSFVMSWLFNGSRGSVLLVILGHNGINWALFAVGTFSGEAVANNWPAALGLAGLAAITIAATRGRLGHPRSEVTAEPVSTSPVHNLPGKNN